MAIISSHISKSVRDFVVLTNWTNTKPEDVSLACKLSDYITLRYPYFTSRMQSVVGEKMVEVSGREGIFNCVPRSLRVEDKQSIIDANNKAKLKEWDVEFATNPNYVGPEITLEETIRLIDKTGHSVIPIVDEYHKLHGVYVHNPDKFPSVSPKTPISKLMSKLSLGDSENTIPYVHHRVDAEEILRNKSLRFVPVVDENMILKDIAFLQKYDTNFIGIAISSRKGWQEEIDMWAPQVDSLMLDSSNACFNDALNILKYSKEKYPDKAFGVGNIIRGEHFKVFAEAGVDYLLVGMAAGSICQTGSERGNGRGNFTAIWEVAKARDLYFEDKKRYIPIVADGGINTVKDITIALTEADFVMMGKYFNRFFESPAKKFCDKEGKIPATEENLIKFVQYWGEGHPKANLVGMFGMNYEERFQQPNEEDMVNVIERYGHSSISAATIEGVVGTNAYGGRLKPGIERDARYLRTTIANCGSKNLAEYRKNAVIEELSIQALKDLSPHDINITEI